MHIQKSFGGWVHRDLDKLKEDWCTESLEKKDGQGGLGRCRKRYKDYLMQINKPCEGGFI